MPLALRQHREFRAGIGMQLLHDPADVVFDGSLGEKQRGADLPIAHSFRDQLENLRLLFRDASAVSDASAAGGEASVAFAGDAVPGSRDDSDWPDCG